jgi:hypothetical protein
MEKYTIKLMKSAILALSVFALSNTVFAKENVGVLRKNSTPSLGKMGAGCAAATQQKDLDLNNVRTTILNGGDVWWNLQNARYEIPRVEPGQTSKHSLFSGALWIGGITQGNLRIAAQTYRQSGNDYYPGALQVDGSASITAARCKFYDQIWKVTLAEIEEFSNDETKWNDPIDGIANWPGNGNRGEGVTGEAEFLAPFFDFNKDGKY